MKSNDLSPQEKKLAVVRRILWICFGSLAAASFFCSFPLFILWRTPETGPPMTEMPSSAFFMYMPFAGMLFFVAFAGVVCLLIYTVFKYRAEKDDEMFL